MTVKTVEQASGRKPKTNKRRKPGDIKMFITIPAEIKKETEKAILSVVDFDSQVGIQTKEVWFPKSQVTVSGDSIYMPVWLAEAKTADQPAHYFGFYDWKEVEEVPAAESVNIENEFSDDDFDCIDC